jgi:hypothetical protein
MIDNFTALDILVKRAKIPPSTASAVESEKQKSLNLDTPKRLASALGVTLDMLAGTD